MKKLSVVMTCYNKANLLPWTLLTLINQKVPPDEVIIIDDGSGDRTEYIVRQFQRYSDVDIKYYYNNNPGFCTCAWGFNCGIKKATNEIIMLTKPEVLHPTQDVKVLLDYFNNPENDRTYLVGKPLYQVHGEDFLEKIMEENFHEPLAITKRPEVQVWHKDLISKDGMITYFPTGGLDEIMGVLRKHLLAVGGFDERLSEPGHRGWEDIDLFQRLDSGKHGYGLKRIKSSEMIPIHLHHTKPPAPDEAKETRNLKIMEENYREHRWKANEGKEWGVLRK